MSVDQQRATGIDRRAFLAYEIRCPFCAGVVGPRFVTREHLDVPPNPPYAATVRCPSCKDIFEVRFTDSPG